MRRRRGEGLLLGPREKDELFCVSLHFLWRYDETEVIEEEELKLELVKLSLWKAADLRISRIGVKYIAEEFTGDGDTGNDKPVHVI